MIPDARAGRLWWVRHLHHCLCLYTKYFDMLKSWMNVHVIPSEICIGWVVISGRPRLIRISFWLSFKEHKMHLHAFLLQNGLLFSSFLLPCDHVLCTPTLYQLNHHRRDCLQFECTIIYPPWWLCSIFKERDLSLVWMYYCLPSLKSML